MARTLKLLTLVGNPKAGSRTLHVAEEVARQIDGLGKAQGLEIATESIDIVTLGAGLFDWDSKLVNDALQKVAEADVLVVASPVYKAAFTGVLKLFLDRIPMEGLAGRIVIPMMVAAAPIHTLAVEVHLRPVLIELGGSCPVRGLVVMESKLSELPDIVGKWLAGAKDVLQPLMRARAEI
ncbi:MAG TPA: NAD(P)H-dependent oxidoreductase [Alphaproteobacteria bacterium]|jgi:FMN reductase|nr:NAD(P)H-dependent oxidoreductase [Alphaproteobacteria bacterium]